MKSAKPSLVTILALSLAASVAACSSNADNGDTNGGSLTGGAGGRSSSGGSGGAVSGSGGGGAAASGGGSGSGSGGSGGGTATGSGGAGSGGAGSGGGAVGSGGTPGSGGESGGDDAGTSETGSAAETGAPAGKMMITVDSDPVTSTPTHLCFKKEASNSGGNHSPKIDWTPPPKGTMSLVLMMEDLSNKTPHRIVCDMMPTETGQVADVKTMVPAGAMVGTGHGKPGNPWYGPGATLHQYEITIFALATPKLQGGCGPDKDTAIKARDYLKGHKTDTTVVLDSDSKILWGDQAGNCK